MSGGVDSSVAAWLLKQQGYDVIGVTMQIWQDEDTDVQEAEGGCCGLSAVDDARRVAMDLGIPYYVMNFREEFRKNVMDYFVGVPFKAQHGDRGGLYCHRPLCTDRAAAKRQICPQNLGYSGEGPDLCPLQPDPGSAGPYPDACGQLL